MLNHTENLLERPGYVADPFNSSVPELEQPLRDPLYVVLPILMVYAVIFISGIVGNVCTCVVIARNRSMHTATNYYLFSMAISDLLLLLVGLPPEFLYIISNTPYMFGSVYCIVQSFASETCANASVLTITAFTVERYVAICYPFISQTISKLSRAVRLIVAIWVLSFLLSVPQAIQFGIRYEKFPNGTINENTAICSAVSELDHAFEISSVFIFIIPMTVITVLYILIGIKLRKSRLLVPVNGKTKRLCHHDSGRNKTRAQRNVIRMLVAVVVAFFICWAPFHAQRLFAVYMQKHYIGDENSLTIYKIIQYSSGILYFLSTTINPLLYNLMSEKFREAFKAMLSKNCGKRRHKMVSRRFTYSSVLRFPRPSSTPRVNSLHSVCNESQKVLSHLQIAEQAEGSHSSDKEPARLFIENTDAVDQLHKKSISRGSSNCSQLTVMTNVSRTCTESNNNSARTCSDESACPAPTHLPLKNITLERLKFSAGLFELPRRAVAQKPKCEPSAIKILQTHPSIESSNTISNSSLQDLGESEFSGIELAQYMGELNDDLIT